MSAPTTHPWPEAAFSNRNFHLMVLADVALFVLAYGSAYMFRFDMEVPAAHQTVFATTLVPIVLTKMTLAHAFGLYRGMWRYTSIVDLFNIVKMAGVSSLLIFSCMLFLRHEVAFSRAVLVLDGGLTFAYVSALRLAIRLYYTQTPGRFFGSDFYARRAKNRPDRNLLIVGADDAGEAILREFHSSRTSGGNVVGFVDDDPLKHGRFIHGAPVLGGLQDLATIAESKAITEVLIAKSTVPAQEMRRIVQTCEGMGVRCTTVPTAGEFLDGKVSLQSVRDVSVEDLLGREPVQLEMDRIGGYLRGKRVLITGAGGSIGSELCRQIAAFGPAHMFLLDRAESPLYDMEMELKHYQARQVAHRPVLASIKNEDLMREIFAQHQPEVVFHAAAYKHVPMLELQPWEAVFNNIVGTNNILKMCREFQVERFVLVSTDKAVRPTNVMGTSKRIAELLTQCYDAVNPHTTHQAVRFGNVVGSAGSVIPLFKKQLERRGALTVTHPDVIRYFMTIPEAAQLILQAGAMGTGGEIFILDMGAPVKIIDLARDLIRLSGFEPDVDVPIDIIGLRPGEKLYEELITEGEGIVKTNHKKIMVLRAGDSASETLTARHEKLQADVAILRDLAAAHNESGIRAKLREMVPEYTPANHDQKPAGSRETTS